MKNNIIRVILILLLMLTFCIIFGFSNQDSEESSDISGGVTQILTSKIKVIQEKEEVEKELILFRIESIIRKLAHFSIYTIVRNSTNGTCIYL